MGFLLIYITHPDIETARQIVTSLMEHRLIACANYFPIQNTYWWNGNIENSTEVVSIVKTKLDNWEKVTSEVIKLHPYTTPCIIKMHVHANDEYESWIQSEVI